MPAALHKAIAWPTIGVNWLVASAGTAGLPAGAGPPAGSWCAAEITVMLPVVAACQAAGT